MKRFTIRYLYVCLAALFVVCSWQHAPISGSAQSQQFKPARSGRDFRREGNEPKQEKLAPLPLEFVKKEDSNGIRDVAADRAVINLIELANSVELQLDSQPRRHAHKHPIKPPDINQSRITPATGKGSALGKPSILLDSTAPAPSASFLAGGDSLTVIPPDTMGAVGPNHLMVTLNSGVTIEDRAGNQIMSVSNQQFWSRFGSLDVNDPRVTYDPYQNRWIYTAMAQPETTSSLVLVGVSQTADPTGNWNLYKFMADPAGQVWADFPSTGFNKNWVVVQSNMFTVQSPVHLDRSNLYVINKADLYANGVGQVTRFSRNDLGSNQAPAITYDANVDTMYLLQNLNGNNNGVGQLRLLTISGSVGSETLTVGPVVEVNNTWDRHAPGFVDFAPQPGSGKIQVNDADFANCFYRNGSVWAAHTVFLPSGGAPTRTAIQWWELGTSGEIKQHALIDDPTGHLFYGFPSIAANKNNDVLIGYSRFAANEFATAAYSYRAGSDPLNLVRADAILKKGQDFYNKAFGGGENRWGDYSGTAIDPVNDIDMWTIQEYAASSSIFGQDRWGTWWARISAGPTTTDVSVSVSPLSSRIIKGTPFSYRLTFKNNGADWATEVQLTNPLPLGVTFSRFNSTPPVPCQSPNQGAGGSVTCDIGFMPPGKQYSLDVLLDTTADLGPILTIGAAMATSSNDLNPSDNSASTDFQITIPASFTIVGGNNQKAKVSTSTADPISVKVVDTNGVGISGLTVAFNVPGNNASVPPIAITDANGIAGTKVSMGPVPGPVTVQASVLQFPPVTFSLTAAAPNMQATLSHVGNFVVGTIGTYALTVANIGNATANNVDVHVHLPVGLVLDSVSASPTNYTCQVDPNNFFTQVQCFSDHPVADGSQTTFSVKVRVDDRAVPMVISKADLTVEGHGTPDQLDPTNVVYAVDLSLGQNAPANILTGQSFSYSLTASNPSPNPAASVIVTDTLPPGIQFNSATPSQGSCTGTTTVLCNLGTIAAKSSATITINVTPNVAGILTNTATITGNVADPNASNNSTTATTMVESSVPVLAGISPTSINAGNPGITLFLNGTGFNQTSVVQWNGANRSTTFVNGTQLQASIPAADLANTGTATVTVFNAPPGGGASNGQIFTITNPFPLVSSVSPGSVLAGGPDQSITINGTGFIGSSVAFLSGQQLQTTFVSSTQIEASLSAGVIAQSGIRIVTVTNPSPGGGSSNTALFLVIGLTTVQTDSKTVGGGSTDTASALPLQAGESGLSATFTNNIGDSADVTVKRYVNGTGIGNLIDGGGGLMDLKVTGADAGDVLAANFYYPSTIIAPAEFGLHLMYFDGSKWHQVRGSGGNLAVQDTTDNLDGTVSGGRFSVTFDGTSTPKITELTGTIFSLSPGLYGDLNKDQIINVGDLIVMANMLAGNAPVDKQSADVLQDGKVNVQDLLTLANFLAGNITTLPLVPIVGQRTIYDLNVNAVSSNSLWLRFTVGQTGYRDLVSPFRPRKYQSTLLGFNNQFPGFGP